MDTRIKAHPFLDHFNLYYYNLSCSYPRFIWETFHLLLLNSLTHLRGNQTQGRLLIPI
jgi:hypothetical protein